MDVMVPEIALAFAKALKAHQMYGGSHPSYQGFFRPFAQRLGQYLETHGELELQIDRAAMKHEGRSVMDESDREGGFVFRLFRDGIRLLSFRQGLTEAEVAALVASIAQAGRDDDLALIIWEQDFAHIGIHVVEEEDEIPEEPPSRTAPPTQDYDSALDQIIQHEGIADVGPLNAHLSMDELKALMVELKDTGRMPVTTLLIGILITYLTIEPASEVIDGLIELLEICVGKADFYNARRILHHLHTYPGLRPAERFENDAAVREFLHLVDTIDDRNFNEFLAFIGYFSPRVVPCFIAGMHRAKNRVRLENLHYRLAAICRDDPQPLLPYLVPMTDVKTLAHAIAIVGIMKPKQLVELLTPLFLHPAPEIRALVVHCLADAGELLLVARAIDDPAGEVRIRVLQELTLHPLPRIYPILLARIKNRAFLALEFNEQKEFFNCLAANGGRHLTKELARMLFRWRLFGRGRYQVIRKLAATVLARSSDADARAVLDAGLRKRNRDVRQACEFALKGT